MKLERRGESWGDGLLKGDLSISVFFTGDEMPEGRGQRVTGLLAGWLRSQDPSLPTAAPAPLPPSSLWARGRGLTL